MDENVSAYLSNEAIFGKLSDVTRIVDPIQKKVVMYKSNNAVSNEVHCFDFWGKNKVCDNCISMRAYNNNTTYVKIEYNKDKTYLVTAVPHDLADRRIVIEILKDITDSVFINSTDSTDKELAGIHALIDNMNKLSFSDPLTGLYNRRYIIEKLPVDLLNATLLSTELSVIMADIDYFKAVNDHYGHLAGDQTLKDVAKILSGSIKRESDWIARYGGEEFLICMPGADLETAKTTAEHMRRLLEQTTIQYNNQQFKVTASFGIHTIKAADSESVDDLVKHADEKLYSAKRNGRNRVEY